ncbi:TadE/TadG family type IV pilus assembly protein [Nocardioides sp.]|uniref:TadE/TadG family type IV pilus assembly protein n=1 Tax=Nocardioides sp. TaxID=35761 RepID=UPI00273557C4|nr:TadE/TadG family type IV pilus assembly protein [Nocardioides sp.]MDP3892583.1 TadE/TadG family type IV pilus assembly protein [Nocardioides sp.]
MRWTRTRRRDASGAAAVEFALVVPLLLVIILGIISYGFMLSFRQSISQAAAEGARAAAVAPASADRQALAFEAIENAIGDSCGSAYLTCATSTPASCSTCLSVTVTYAYTADPSKPTFGFGIAMPDELTYTAVSEISQ